MFAAAAGGSPFVHIVNHALAAETFSRSETELLNQTLQGRARPNGFIFIAVAVNLVGEVPMIIDVPPAAFGAAVTQAARHIFNFFPNAVHIFETVTVAEVVPQYLLSSISVGNEVPDQPPQSESPRSQMLLAPPANTQWLPPGSPQMATSEPPDATPKLTCPFARQPVQEGVTLHTQLDAPVIQVTMNVPLICWQFVEPQTDPAPTVPAITIWYVCVGVEVQSGQVGAVTTQQHRIPNAAQPINNAIAKYI